MESLLLNEEQMLSLNQLISKLEEKFGKDYIYPKMQDLYYYKAKGVRLIRFPFRAARVLEDLDGEALDYDQTNSDIKAMKAVVDEAVQVDFYSDEFGSYNSIVRGNYIPNGYLVRKNIYDKIGRYSTEAPLEDWWLMLQIAKFAKMKYILLMAELKQRNHFAWLYIHCIRNHHLNICF